MTAPRVSDGRLRAYAQFLAAIFYYFLARALANHGSRGVASEQWEPLIDQLMLVFLLLLGFAGFGFALNRQLYPISEQGLPRRPGWPQETAMGLAMGWAAAVVCVLAMALGGGIAISLSLSLASWGWLLVNAAYFALATLAEEIAFRGYAFQRFARAVGSAGAVLGFAILYAFMQGIQPGTTHASSAVAFVFAVVLSTAYLRTRALWVSWGLNFGWKASRALLFGLAVTGDNSHSPLVQGDPMGSFWLTGGGFGLEGSWLAFVVLLALLPVVYRVTRDLDFKYNAPEIIPAGIPVDLDAAARRQHDAAMGPAAEPAPPGLIQILPLTTVSNPLIAPAAPATGESAANPAPPPSNSGNETL